MSTERGTMLRVSTGALTSSLQQLGVAGAAETLLPIETPLFFGALYVFS
jgi:hypothetical protein